MLVPFGLERSAEECPAFDFEEKASVKQPPEPFVGNDDRTNWPSLYMLSLCYGVGLV